MKSTVICIIIAGSVAFVPRPAEAQANPARNALVDQLGRSQPIGMNQVSDLPVPAQQSGRVAPQISAHTDSAAPARQLTAERGAGPSLEQLNRAGPSAQPPQPLSTTRDGRTAAVERVAGSDRCDPALNQPRRMAKCAVVIETRAAEFAHSDPSPLSPEQRILAEQSLRRLGNLSDVRKLGANGDDARLVEFQGVASLVLGKPGEPPPDKAKQDPAQAEQINAIVNAIVGQMAPR